MTAKVLNFYRERHRLTLERMDRALKADLALMERLGIVRFERPRRAPFGRGPGGGNGAA